MNLSCSPPILYMFRVLPVANTTPSSFSFILWNAEEQEVKIWHCMHNAIVNDNDWLQTSITGNENNSNNLVKRPQHLQTHIKLTLPSQHPKSLCAPDRRRQAPNNTACTSSFPGACRHGASSNAGVPHVPDLDPRRGRRSRTAEVPRRTSGRNQKCVHGLPRRA